MLGEICTEFSTPVFHVIGDCNMPRTIYFATSDAYNIVNDLGVVR